MAFSELPDKIWIFHRQRAQDHPIQAKLQQLLHPLTGSHPSPELHRNGEGCRDGADGSIVHGLPLPRPIQIHQMESGGPLVLP